MNETIDEDITANMTPEGRPSHEFVMFSMRLSCAAYDQPLIPPVLPCRDDEQTQVSLSLLAQAGKVHPGSVQAELHGVSDR